MDTVSNVTFKLIKGADTDAEKIERIFYYVRDEIKFDFVDQFQDSEKILNSKRGACMNKALLLKDMATCANIPARLHFMRVSKSALEDCMPEWLFNKWPTEFYHTLVEVNIMGTWVSMEATFDQEFHEILLKKNLNFAKDETRRINHFSNEFSIEGINAPQQDCLIKGSPSKYGADLSFLKESMKELPFWKRKLAKIFFKQASNYVNQNLRLEEM